MLYRKPGDYKIEPVPASAATGVKYYEVFNNASGTWQLATPWKFLDWRRAWLWIDKNNCERREECARCGQIVPIKDCIDPIGGHYYCKECVTKGDK